MELPDGEGNEPQSGGTLSSWRKRVTSFSFKRESQLPDDPKRMSAQAMTSEEKEGEEYQSYLALSQGHDFTELAQLQFLTTPGTDTAGRPIVMVVPAHLPVKKIDFDKLLLFVIHVMDSLVEREYSLVYVQSGASSQNRPAFSWLRKCYRILNRKYKKNLKALYVVHPTFWVKGLTKLFKPFVSAKFWQKLIYIEEINEIHRFISKDQIKFPEVVYKYVASKQKGDPIFGASIEEVLARPDHEDLQVPIVVAKCAKFLKESKPTDLQGIFRLSGQISEIQRLRKEFDRGETVTLGPTTDPHAVGGLFKLYFRELPEPLFPFESYPKLLDAHRNPDTLVALGILLKELPAANKAVLHELLGLLSFIEKNATVNKMNSSNLSIVFAPNLIRSPTENLQQTMLDTPLINSVMRTMIESTDQLLPVLSDSFDSH